MKMNGRRKIEDREEHVAEQKVKGWKRRRLDLISQIQLLSIQAELNRSELMPN